MVSKQGFPSPSLSMVYTTPVGTAPVAPNEHGSSLIATCLRYLPLVSDEDGLASPVHCVEHSRCPIRARRHQFGASGVKAHVEDLVVMPPEGVDALPASDVPYLSPSTESNRSKWHNTSQAACCVVSHLALGGKGCLACVVLGRAPFV